MAINTDWQVKVIEAPHFIYWGRDRERQMAQEINDETLFADVRNSYNNRASRLPICTSNHEIGDSQTRCVES